MAGSRVSVGWTPEEVDFPSSLNGWQFTCPVVKFLGPDGSPEWFRYELTAPSAEATFPFKMVLGNAWGYDFGGNPSFPKNELGLMYFHPGGNSLLAGGVSSGNHYVFTVKNPGLADTSISVMEFSGTPVLMTGVEGGLGSFSCGQTVPITITFSGVPPPEERAYVRLTTNHWASSWLVPALSSGVVARAEITNLQPASEYEWYALASSATPEYLMRQEAYGVNALSMTWLNNYGDNYHFTTLQDEAGWVFHGNDRVAMGGGIVIWAKVGYVNTDGSNPWVTNAAVYYTLDGSIPAGRYGVALTPSTHVKRMRFDHIENDISHYGGAMKWVAILEQVPAYTTVRYKIGAWKEAGRPEHFADYRSGYEDQVFNAIPHASDEPLLTVESEGNGRIDGDSGTSRFFLDEVAGESVPMTVEFEPNQARVIAAEVFSNLNRRDWANQDSDGDGIPDGMVAPAGDSIESGTVDQYYAAYPMTLAGQGVYRCVLPVRKTGAYRLTVRWKCEGDRAWRWYSQGGRGDHAIVVSPRCSRDMRIYEANALIANARGPSEAERGTLEDLTEPASYKEKRLTLDSMRELGCNWLWLQPLHPRGEIDRAVDPTNGKPYPLGNPYAVRNYFEISPWLSRSKTASASLGAFTNLVEAADRAGMRIALEAPFNYTALDCELGGVGVSLFAPGASEHDQLRDREARVFSRAGNYAMRASTALNIAPAPDRGDFGKWSGVGDVYLGLYSSLVDVNPVHNYKFLAPGDWMDTSVGLESVSGEKNGHFDLITRNVWRYFAQYLAYWLDRTGYPQNGTHAVLDSDKGIDGYYGTFASGAPSRFWEYVINTTRARKWNFVFMAESLDGDAVTCCLDRQFDVVRENMSCAVKRLRRTSDYRDVFDQRRMIHGNSLVFLNVTAHDKEYYNDIWQAAIRDAVMCSMPGVPMVFYGQELGITRLAGFDRYERFYGRYVPNFETWNSLRPAWAQAGPDTAALRALMASVNEARSVSAALESGGYYYLNQPGGQAHPLIWAVARYQEACAAPADKDVVLAFVNLDRNGVQTGVFNLNLSVGGANLLGIKAGHRYNLRNLAAYTGNDALARTRWVWPRDKDGAELLSQGIYVRLNSVPVSSGQWQTAPYEAQYLKLYDMEPPVPPLAPVPDHVYNGTNLIGFSWSPSGGKGEAGATSYLISIGSTPGGDDVVSQASVGKALHYGCSGRYDTTNYAAVWSVSAAGVTSIVAAASDRAELTGEHPPAVILLPDVDSDGDGVSNSEEARIGTDPMDPESTARIITMQVVPGVVGRGIACSTRPGRTYRIYFNDVKGSLEVPWIPFGNMNNGYGSWVETNRTPTVHLFQDDESPDSTGYAPTGSRRYYRIDSH